MQEKEIINTVMKFTEKISNGENFSKHEAIFVLNLIKKTNCNLNVYKGMIVVHYFFKFKEFPDLNLKTLIKDEKFLKLVALLNGESLPPSEVGKIFLEILKISDLESDYRDILMGCFYGATWSFMNNPENYEKAIDYGIEIIKSAFSLDDFDIYKKINTEKNGMKIINLAGSGKKEIKLLNISSLAAMITAAVGEEIGENIVVAKTVSKATSSVTGSRDIFELLGVNLDLPINKIFEILLKTRIGVFDINRIVPRLNHVYDGRLYNVQVFAGLVGGAAIVNPVDADLIIYGLTRGSIKVCLAILKKLYPDKNIIVMQGKNLNDKPIIDEISICGNTTVAQYVNDDIIIKEISPREFGFDFKPFINIQSNQDPQENLKDFIKILIGQGKEELKQVVAMEVALNLYGLGIVKDLKTGARLALEVINAGKGIDILKNLIIYTQGNIDQFYKILETINLPKKLIE